MKLTRIVTAAIVCAGASFAAGAQAPVAPSDSLSVAVGTVLGDYIRGSVSQLASLGAVVDLDRFSATMDKMLRGEPSGMTVEQANAFIDAFMRATRPDELPDSFTPESQQAFLDSVAALPGAVRTPSGLVMIVEKEGEGPFPADTSDVRLTYKGRFSDGTIFDATGSPVVFRVNELCPGFTEGLKLMKPGGSYRIVMPASLAYGTGGIPGAIPGNAALDFSVDLIEIK